MFSWRAPAPEARPPHPYFPIGVALSSPFVANDRSVSSLVQAFAAAVLALLVLTYVVAKRVRPGIVLSDLGLVLWFILTGSIHVIFEGYFVLHHDRLASSQAFLAQLWKEYALSDSRYLTSDPLVLCMEACTVITWGPLSLLTAFLILRNSPHRHSVQALVSTGHIYGDVLYFATTVFDEIYSGKGYCRPEPFYFWVYFVLMNAVWIVIPGSCLYDSVKATVRAFESAKSGGGKKKKTV